MEHGYYCGVICKDIFEESDKINKIASMICKKVQSKGNVKPQYLYVKFDFNYIKNRNNEFTNKFKGNMVKERY